jgi:hypothetical protein
LLRIGKVAQIPEIGRRNWAKININPVELRVEWNYSISPSTGRQKNA